MRVSWLGARLELPVLRGASCGWGEEGRRRLCEPVEDGSRRRESVPTQLEAKSGAGDLSVASTY